MFHKVLGALNSSKSVLTTIKAAHTVVWAFLCIAAVWVFAWQAEYFNAALSIGIVLIKVIVLVLNGLHCPLTQGDLRHALCSRNRGHAREEDS